MIVKILSASKTFKGVNYSEKKAATERGELLTARNFGALDLMEKATKVDYINYLTKLGETNKRVVNKQFHAVISCRGVEYNKEELKGVAVEYLKIMGYGDNPYLIYFHSDTANNHLHMVTSRVNKQGKKISDTYEQIRSGKAIAHIMGINREHVYEKNAQEVLSFSFSSLAQFKLLWEERGYKVREKEGNYQIIKDGQCYGSIRKEDIDTKISAYNLNHLRSRQLSAIINKYKGVYKADLYWQGVGLPGGAQSKEIGRLTSDLAEYLVTKVGIKLVFHRKTGTLPYGYTIIDQAEKQVFKGGEVIPLGELLQAQTAEERLIKIEDFVTTALIERKGYTQLKDALRSNGIILSSSGEIRFKGAVSPVYILDPAEMRELKYVNRVEEAQQFSAVSSAEKLLLSKIFHVKQEDIELTDQPGEKTVHLTNMVKGIFENEPVLSVAFTENKLKVIKNGDSTYIMDISNHEIINVINLLTPEEVARMEFQLGDLNVMAIADRFDATKSPERFASAAGQLEHSEKYSGSHSLGNVLTTIKDEHDPIEPHKKKRKVK